MVQKKLRSKNKSLVQKNLGPKHDLEKTFVPKKFGSHKNLESKNILQLKKFWAQRKLWVEKKLGSNKNCRSKKMYPKQGVMFIDLYEA